MNAQLHWTAGVHHDGSSLYVSNPQPALNDIVTLRLRVPAGVPIQKIYARTVPDGESTYLPMQRTSSDGVSDWWEAEMTASMSRNPYRFKIFAADGVYHFNALGISRSENLDLFDFKLLTNYQSPKWVYDSVFYHIFVDRFYNGDPSTDVQDGEWEVNGVQTQRRTWGEAPYRYEQGGSLDFFNGDLPGIGQKVDYLRDLGVNTVYLTPIFNARTNHRYDTSDFDHIDPHVGGEAGLAALRETLDQAGMHLVLDIVVNHIGWHHPWFISAVESLEAPTAGYFTFYQHPHSYENWLGHKSLVKLNYRSQALREAIYLHEQSALRRWMQPPYSIDGWRLDVFNMMARQGETRLEHKIGREMRRVLKKDNPSLYFFGEHFYDGVPHLQGDEVDGVMNYAGFGIPLRQWLKPQETGQEENPHYKNQIGAETMAEQWARWRGAIPYTIARQQYHMLGSHDTPRMLTVLGGDKSLLKLAAGMMMTYPGIPSIYYGDEVGMAGGRDPDNRHPMIWEEDRWDHDVRDHFKRLAHLRRTAPALIDGGYQDIYALDNLIAFQRQSPDQRLVIIGYRGPGMLAPFSLPVKHAGLKDGAVLTDLLSGASFRVEGGAIGLADLAPGSVLVLEENQALIG